MMQVSVKLHGAAEIAARMRELPKRLDTKLLNRALLAGAAIGRDAARVRAPVLRDPDPRRRPGTLRRRIRAFVVRPQGYRATVFVGVVGLSRRAIARFKAKQAKRGGKASGSENPNDPFYWVFQEFGTSTQAARPFLRPGFEATKHESVRVAIDTSRTLVQGALLQLARERP